MDSSLLARSVSGRCRRHIGRHGDPGLLGHRVGVDGDRLRLLVLLALRVEFHLDLAFLAEQKAHHPTFHNEFSYVRIELHTHDAGRVVTDRDRELAEAIDGLLQ